MSRTGRTFGRLGLALLALTLLLWIGFGLLASGPEPDSRLVADLPLAAAAVAVVALLFVLLLTSSVRIGG